MSSPTISINNASLDSIETVMNLVRAILNDSQAGATGTPGEGQIFVDNTAIAPFVQPFLNSAIRELYRELRNAGQPALIKDNVIVSGLTPANSPTMGVGAYDPSVQVYLGFNGYFDGVSINANLMLPPDMITPVRMWERATGSNDQFQPMKQPDFGLPSRPQDTALAEWEWRGQAIWMVGSTGTRDVRMRYYCSLPQYFGNNLQYGSLFVPIIDSTDALAYKIASKFASSTGAPAAEGLKAEAAEQMRQLKLASVRRAQSVDYQRIPYGRNNGGPGNDSSGASWGDGGQ